jgi:hypothetical protein
LADRKRQYQNVAPMPILRSQAGEHFVTNCR